MPLALEIEISAVFVWPTAISLASSRHNVFVCVLHERGFEFMKEQTLRCRSATRLTQRADSGLFDGWTDH